ncbi:MAG: phosphohydrolase [Methanobacteriota archaeon]|nr:MAG: phosphohydrolase [Euryarchaeota archaeon]
MNFLGLRDELIECFKLKDLSRSGWINSGLNDVESVAAHTWGVSYLCYVLCPDGLNKLKVLSMAIVHDIGEAIIGDITPHDLISRERKYQMELSAIKQLTNFTDKQSEIIDLWLEYESNETEESKFVKACDKLDMALQSSIYELRYKSFNPEEFIDSALEKIDDEYMKLLATNTVKSKNPN